MSQTNVRPDGADELPHWRRVSKLAELVEIFEPGVQVCTWKRQVDPAIERYLCGLDQSREVKEIEFLSQGA